jgi:hypothetical protein
LDPTDRCADFVPIPAVETDVCVLLRLILPQVGSER